MSKTIADLEPWQIEELNDRANRRCYGLINFEDNETGEMIPGIYVVYAWSGQTLESMRLGGGRVTTADLDKAIEYCSRLDYNEVTERMGSKNPKRHNRWTVSYLPFIKL